MLAVASAAPAPEDRASRRQADTMSRPARRLASARPHPHRSPRFPRWPVRQQLAGAFKRPCSGVDMPAHSRGAWEGEAHHGCACRLPILLHGLEVPSAPSTPALQRRLWFPGACGRSGPAHSRGASCEQGRHPSLCPTFGNIGLRAPSSKQSTPCESMWDCRIRLRGPRKHGARSMCEISAATDWSAAKCQCGGVSRRSLASQ